MKTTKMTRWLILWMVLATALAATAAAFASTPGPAIEWNVSAGGGGSVTGGSITLDSTLGQPVTGISGSGNILLNAGYWSAEQPTQVFLPLLSR